MHTQKLKTIDIHSHFILPSYVEGLQKMGISPLKEDGIALPRWSEEEHLSYMEEADIDYCVLALSSPHIHHGNDQLAREITRALNEEISGICNKHPGQLGFAACLPTPDIDGSIDEVNYAMDVLNARAVKIPSNSNGVYLGDEIFDPLFEVLNERNAVIIIHPSPSKQKPKNVITGELAPLFEFLADTTRTVLNLITTGTLKKYPDIKIVVPHNGSFLPSVIQRLVSMSEVMVAQGFWQPTDVMGSFSKLYFDTAGDTLPVALESLLKVTDPSHIMYGADWPYTPIDMIIRNKRKLVESEMFQPYANAILYDNAKNLFNI